MYMCVCVCVYECICLCICIVYIQISGHEVVDSKRRHKTKEATCRMWLRRWSGGRFD